MVKRVTIVLDEDVHNKLRRLQAKMIQESGKAVSFSRVVNESLTKTSLKAPQNNKKATKSKTHN